MIIMVGGKVTGLSCDCGCGAQFVGAGMPEGYGPFHYRALAEADRWTTWTDSSRARGENQYHYYPDHADGVPAAAEQIFAAPWGFSHPRPRSGRLCDFCLDVQL